MKNNKQTSECCEFCGKHISKIGKVITSPSGIIICNECVELCTQLLDECADPNTKKNLPTKEDLLKQNIELLTDLKRDMRWIKDSASDINDTIKKNMEVLKQLNG